MPLTTKYNASITYLDMHDKKANERIILDTQESDFQQVCDTIMKIFRGNYGHDCKKVTYFLVEEQEYSVA